eukprot:7900277-Ditylum_brightwellii.AAC.1
MQWSGQLPQARGQVLTRQIRALLKEDRKQRAANVASEIEVAMAEGDLAEAWQKLKGWYHAVEDRPPTPCRKSMATQTREREELYREVPPPGDLIPINVDTFEIRDKAPDDAELRAVVTEMRNGRAGGASTIRAEDLKAWLRGM